MSELTNNNQKQKTAPKTDYANGIFQGMKYASQENAIEAGAKQYAKMDWETIRTLNEQLDVNITPKQLISAKKQIIERSLEKRNEMPREFE